MQQQGEPVQLRGSEPGNSLKAPSSAAGSGLIPVQCKKRKGISRIWHAVRHPQRAFRNRPRGQDLPIPERLYDNGEQLRDPQMFNLFLSFCQTRDHSEENPLFWQAVTEFEQNPNLLEAQNILESYLKEGEGKNTVNIPSEVVKEIENEINLRNITDKTFEKAKAEVIGMMQQTWQRFKTNHQ